MCHCELIRPIFSTGRKPKVRKDDQPRVPRSLFDRPSAALRRDAKQLVKLKQAGISRLFKPNLPSSAGRPLLDAPEHPEWLIHEDWALLQAVQILLELPLNLSTPSPAHIPNWDLVADVVNAQSRTYRSPKQCKNRYENVIVPREEGKILYDINPRKQKKSKGIYKVGPLKVVNLHFQLPRAFKHIIRINSAITSKVLHISTEKNHFRDLPLITYEFEMLSGPPPPTQPFACNTQ